MSRELMIIIYNRYQLIQDDLLKCKMWNKINNY